MNEGCVFWIRFGGILWENGFDEQAKKTVQFDMICNNGRNAIVTLDAYSCFLLSYEEC